MNVGVTFGLFLTLIIAIWRSDARIIENPPEGTTVDAQPEFKGISDNEIIKDLAEALEKLYLDQYGNLPDDDDDDDDDESAEVGGSTEPSGTGSDTAYHRDKRGLRKRLKKLEKSVGKFWDQNKDQIIKAAVPVIVSSIGKK